MTRRSGVRGTAADPWPFASRGQATVEFALLLPLVVMVALMVVQVGVIVHARVMVTHAAREGVRVAAVGGEDGQVRQVVVAAGALLPSRVGVEVERSSGRATVQVDYDAPTDVPIVGSLIGDVELTATATMRIEQ